MAALVTGGGEGGKAIGDGLEQKPVSGSGLNSTGTGSKHVGTVEGSANGESSLDQKKHAVTDKLRKRDEERMAVMQQRRAEKDVKEDETTDYFKERFAGIKSEIDEGLKNADSVDESGRNDHFDKLVVLVQSLQKLLTNSAHFLSSYIIQSAQESINQLRETVEQKRATVAPKKKFAFKGGKKKVGTESIEPQVNSSNGQASASASKTISSHSSPEDESCSFRNLADKTLSISAQELAGRRPTLSSLRNCTVVLHGSMHALTADNLTDCRISCGPVSGSVFVDKCVRCEFSVACQQLRVHTTSDTSFYLHVTSRAIIEDCKGILTAPYTLRYNGLDEQFRVAGLDRTRNTWDDIDDFDWLASDVPSPNWAVMDSCKRHEWK